MPGSRGGDLDDHQGRARVRSSGGHLPEAVGFGQQASANTIGLGEGLLSDHLGLREPDGPGRLCFGQGPQAGRLGVGLRETADAAALGIRQRVAPVALRVSRQTDGMDQLPLFAEDLELLDPNTLLALDLDDADALAREGLLKPRAPEVIREVAAGFGLGEVGVADDVGEACAEFSVSGLRRPRARIARNDAGVGRW